MLLKYTGVESNAFYNLLLSLQGDDMRIDFYDRLAWLNEDQFVELVESYSTRVQQDSVSYLKSGAILDYYDLKNNPYCNCSHCLSLRSTYQPILLEGAFDNEQSLEGF